MDVGHDRDTEGVADFCKNLESLQVAYTGE